jgi:hypothetical protein
LQPSESDTCGFRLRVVVQRRKIARAVTPKLVKVVIALIFPTVVFMVFNHVQERLSKRDVALTCRKQAVDPLNTRLHYNADDAAKFWGSLADPGPSAEQTYLKLDLLFPFLYGGALMISLLWLLSASGVGWPRSSVVLPVIIAMLGDWTENLIQLEQLPRFVTSGRSGLDDGAILFSSVATDIKLGGIIVASGLALWLAGIVLTHSKSR